MNDDQIKHMVNRFLTWRLPTDFRPDAGISYVRPNYGRSVDATPWGTNLFTAVQAEAMVRHLVEGVHADRAYTDISLERTRQDAQWGGPAHDDGHAAHHWLEFIDRQLTKAVVTDEADFSRDPVQIRARLVKISALAIAGIQAIDRAGVRFGDTDV